MSWYTVTGWPATGAPGTSAPARSELLAIQTAFGKLPDYAVAAAGTALVVNPSNTGIGTTTGTLALAGNFATTGAFNTTLVQGASVSLTLPVVNGTLATLSGTETLSNKTISGSSNTLSNIGNAALTNSSMTIAGHSVSLGGTQAIAAADLSNGVTGSGSVVLATSATLTSATLVTPALGTPASGTLTNCAGLPVSTGVSGLGTGVATLLSGTASGTGGPAGTASPTFSGTITNGGTISGGTVSNATISGGTFSGNINSSATITGGTFDTIVISGVTISNGTFSGGSTVSTAIGGGTILGATITTSTISGLTVTTTTGTFTLANAKTLTVDNSLEFAGTDSTKMTFPSTSATIARTDAGQTFTGTQTVGSLQIGSGSVISNLTQFATWTPTDQSGASLALTVADARFARIGNIIIATFTITYPSTASGATAAVSLPVTPNATFEGAIGIETNSGTATVALVAGAASQNLLFQNATSAASLTNANLSGKALIGTIIYSA